MLLDQLNDIAAEHSERCAWYLGMVYAGSMEIRQPRGLQFVQVLD